MTQNNIDVQTEKAINYALQYGTSIERAMQETHTIILDICKTYDIYYDILSERIEKVCNEIVEQKKSKKNFFATLKDYKLASKFTKPIKALLKNKYGVVID